MTILGDFTRGVERIPRRQARAACQSVWLAVALLASSPVSAAETPPTFPREAEGTAQMAQGETSPPDEPIESTPGSATTHRTRYSYDAAPECDPECSCSEDTMSTVTITLGDGNAVIVQDEGSTHSEYHCGEEGRSHSVQWNYVWTGTSSLDEDTLVLSLTVRDEECFVEGSNYTRISGGHYSDMSPLPTQELTLNCDLTSLPLRAPSEAPSVAAWLCSPTAQINASMSAFPWAVGVEVDLHRCAEGTPDNVTTSIESVP